LREIEQSPQMGAAKTLSEGERGESSRRRSAGAIGEGALLEEHGLGFPGAQVADGRAWRRRERAPDQKKKKHLS